jgi:hypothetical protein
MRATIQTIASKPTKTSIPYLIMLFVSDNFGCIAFAAVRPVHEHIGMNTS